MKVCRVIRAADKRARSDMEKTFLARDVAIIIELLGRDVFDNRQMLRTRAQILAHCENFAAYLAQIINRLEEFRLFFAEAEHHSALRHNVGRYVPRPSQNSQGRMISGER